MKAGTRTCKACGKQFWTDHSRKVFCSPECAVSTKYCYEFKCLCCGTSFRAAKKTRKYCSWECRKKHEHQLYEESLPMCRECGVKKVSAPHNLFCSIECAASSRKELPTLFCDHCGDEITEWRARNRNENNYCSNECRGLGSRNAGKSKTSGGYVLVVADLDFPGTLHGGATTKRFALEHVHVFWKAYGYIPPKGWDIHHINFIKDDNRIENLIAMPSWLHHKLHAKLRFVKLTSEDVIDIKNRLIAREPQSSIAKSYNIKSSMVSMIKTGKSWAGTGPSIPEPTYNCDCCGVEFIQKTIKHRFCSSKCKQRWAKKQEEVA